MVNLPIQEKAFQTPRSHHFWGSRLSKKDREAAKLKLEPASLDELDSLAERATELANKITPSPDTKETVVRLLRQQYNMEFKLICSSPDCQEKHYQDEIYAPER